MQAINGNGNAIGQLATTLNSDINAVQTAINSIQSSIQTVGANVGLTGQQVINAIQSGNQSLSAQFAQCCCDNKLLVTTQGYENQIATLNQTNALQGAIATSSGLLGDKIDAQTTLLNDKFCELEMREMQAKIDSLLEEKNSLKSDISQAQQTAQIQAYVNSLVTPLTNEIASFKCRLPETVSVPYSPVTAIPSCVAWQYGVNPYFNGNGTIWS